MATRKLRVSVDANVIIAGIRWPRWPFEVLRFLLTNEVHLILLESVLVEARRHLSGALERAALDAFLATATYEYRARPSAAAVAAHRDLVRDAEDVASALGLLDAGADIFVTSDRDFTDPGATAARFRARVQVMLPAVFLRDMAGWSSERLESIRYRRWNDWVR